ncbi:MAG: hypothetical protein ACHQIG_09320 [Acidimicrobiia bacterium]
MARKNQDEADDAEQQLFDAPTPERDSSFEAAQQLLQAAVAEIRSWEPSPEAVELDELDDSSAHRHWRRRIHTDTGEHAAVPAAADELFTDGATDSEPDVMADDTTGAPSVAADATAAAALVSGDVASHEVPAEPETSNGTTPEPASSPPASRGRRRRSSGPGRPQTIGAPTADYVLAFEQPVEVGAESEITEPPATSLRGRRILVASLAAVVAIAAIAFALSTTGSNDQVASPPAKVQPRLEFDPVTTPEGVSVARVWKLQGDQGDQFTGQLSFTNPASTAVTTTFTEVIPKALALSVTAITFDPKPVVVKADPVVQYTETIAPGATFVASYAIGVPPDGATRERLLKWSEDLQAEVGTTTTTTTRPPTPTIVAPPPSEPTPTTTPTTAPRATGPTPTTSAPAPTPTNPPEPVVTSPPPPPPPPVVPGSITVRVQTVNGASGTFNFSGGVSLVVGPDRGVSSAAMTVNPGQYPWTLLNGHVSNLDCTDRDSGPFDERSTVSGATATFNVQPGENVTCIWRVDAA